MAARAECRVYIVNGSIYAGIEQMLAKIGDMDRRTTSIFSRSRGFSVAQATSEDLCWHGPESDGDKRLTPPSTT